MQILPAALKDDTDGVRTVFHLVVPRQRPSRPRTRVETARRYRLRVVVDDVPVLYARIESYWDTAWLACTGAAPRVLPAIDAETVRRVVAADDVDEKWCRWFVHALSTSPLAASPLHEGDWFVSIVRPVAPKQAWSHPFASSDGHSMFPPLVLRPSTTSWWDELWSFGDDDERMPQGVCLPLRTPGAEDEGRLRWWRKQARADTLPPVLVWFVPLLQKFIVLDGHVRLQAALDEGVTPTFCAVWSAQLPRSSMSRNAERALQAAADMEARGVGTVADRNRIVTTAYGMPLWPAPSLRAWSLAASTWRDEVTAVLRGAQAPASFIDEMLLAR